MRVMVLVKATEDSEKGMLHTTEAKEMMEAMGKFNEELSAAGILRQGDGLKPSSAGKRVGFNGARRMVLDGPFAETKEQLAGFYIIECADLDEAIEVAAKHPVARFGMIEVRPFWPL